MRIDLKTVPFSRSGSTMAISRRPCNGQRPEGLYLRAVHGSPKWGDIFRISLLRSLESHFTVECSPTKLRLIAEGGHAEFIFAEPSLIQFRASGVGVRLEMNTGRFDNAQPLDASTWMVCSFGASTKLLLSTRRGQLKVDAPWEQLQCRKVVADFIEDENGEVEGVIREIADHVPVKVANSSFTGGLADVRKDWEAWRKATRGDDRQYGKTLDLAAYVNWSAMAPPRGFFTRPAMLMSKNIMSNVWSWDHCFNAMAHCDSHPGLAWDQFMIFFDHQTPRGAIPDCIGDVSIEWDFTKPPVHGWALNWMLGRGLKLNAAQMTAAYHALSRHTEWWLRDRDYDGDGRPEYYHGNDSGWDNGTVFKSGGPVESPDLICFLLLQMETLSILAGQLKLKKQADAWQKRSEGLMAKLIEEYWRTDHFIAYGPDNKEITDSQSLFLYLPLVLGARLPAKIRESLLRSLKTSGLITGHGLATESPQSALYEADGYWRGPIWAPSTLLIVDGLWDMGEYELAGSISEKFCRLCAHSGFAENFDALSGAGLRDSSYTWTASVFLILAGFYKDRRN